MCNTDPRCSRRISSSCHCYLVAYTYCSNWCFFLSYCTANLLYILYMRNNRRTNCFPENMPYDDDDLELQHLKISSVDIISLIRIYILYDYSRFVFDIWNARVFILQIFGKRCLETIKMQTTKLKCIYSTISIFTDYIKMYV